MITFEPDDPQRDPGLDALLDLDGEAFVIDPAGQYWVYFRVRRTRRTSDKPHGLEYSITLHGPEGKRLVGFDNAHSVRGTAGPGGRPGMITGIDKRRPGRTGTRMQQRCWQTSGERLRLCSKNEV